MRSALGLLLLLACDAGTAPAPVEPARVAPVLRDAAVVADPFATCVVLPQPAKPGHTSVEPDDMICVHGDTPYECPKDFDGAAHGCRVGRSSAWCCPQGR
ncbi:MAG TPA: hypothetical protein VF403_09120 [Kofleriaceae bacterium]